MKGQPSSERAALALHSPLVTIENYGPGEFYIPAKSSYLEHRAHAKKGYDRAAYAVASGEYKLVVLDEIVNALNSNLVTFEELCALIGIKHPDSELVLTGRDAPTVLYDHCDLVTEMREIKHYYYKGNEAREGIEF